MGILNGSKSEQIAFLEEERKKLWERVTQLEELSQGLKKEIETKTPEVEKEAKQHSKKAAEYRNKTENRYKQASDFINQFKKELEVVREVKDEINECRNEASSQKISIDETKSRLDDTESEYSSKLDTLNSKINFITNILDKHPDLEEELQDLDGFIEKIEENKEKSNVSLSAVNKRKKEIDELHREIFGYEDEDEETGETINIEGLKGELETAYENLQNEIEESQERVNEINSNYEEKYNSFESQFKKQYQNINDKIAALLPNALTAGLSAAFSKKKDDEVTSAGKLQTRFSRGIYSLVGVSLIPVAISIFFLTTGVALEEVINRLPRLVLAIVPIYIPILWFTYSANKKLNLSKRLIEEYAHKEVLSRTYEGLSTQINNIENSEQSEELKFRLLSNFLQVSSENPGKLISNYEASDHPVMEALEQSYKFQMTLDKLEGIPGMGKVAAILQKKAKDKLSAKEEVIEKALDVEDEEVVKG